MTVNPPHPPITPHPSTLHYPKKKMPEKKNWDIHRTFKMADPEDAAIPSSFF